MNVKKLKDILEQHKLWLIGDPLGKRADLRSADLSYADLRSAKLNKVVNLFYPMSCPDVGSFIAWKKAFSFENRKECIVKLEVLEDAKRSSSTGRKCRCSAAKVIDIISVDGKNCYQKAVSSYNQSFVYAVGKVVSVNDFCENRWE